MATLTQLEYLVAVDRMRHFRKAAQACHVSQPTLSMQLHKMEEEYGITFFDRSKQPILATPEGEAVIEQAKVILMEMGKLDYLCKNRTNEPSGEFRLALIPTIAPYLLPLFIGPFAQHHPKVKLSVREMTTDQIIRALEDDIIDAGILATPLRVESLIETPLFYEPFSVYVSEGHPLAKQNHISEDSLDAKDIWLLTEGHCLRNQIVRVCSLRGKPGIFPNVQFESGSLDTVIRLVEQGHGYTLLPYLAAQTVKKQNQYLLKPFNKPVPSREVSLVCRRSQYKRLILQALAEEIRSSLPPDLPQQKTKKIEIIKI